MNHKIFLLAAGLLFVSAASIRSGNVPIESFKTSHAVALQMQAEAIPVHLEGEAKGLRCTSRLKWNFNGYHNKCPYGRVVTGVQITGDIAILSCAEVEVTCE